MKFVPTIVTTVPPAVVPTAGVTPVTTGDWLDDVYVNLSDVPVAEAPALYTVTSTTPEPVSMMKSRAVPLTCTPMARWPPAR